MIRNLGFAMGFVLAMVLAATAHAQAMPDDAGIAERAPVGAPSFLNQPYGGFGLEYSQPLASGSVVMDQYGMWHDIPYVQPATSAMTALPSTPAGAMVSSRTSRSASNRVVRQPRYHLTTGSLGPAAGGGGAVLYTPGMRHESYGNGYGRGPYGVTDYSYMWKGWSTD